MIELSNISGFEIAEHVQEIQAKAEAELASASNSDDEKTDMAGCERRTWPALSQTAFHGLPGEIVRLIEPHTEADSVALLIQLLAGFGSLIGKTAYFGIGGDFHYTKLFAVLVGA